jgi:hypothetical protein
VAEPLTYVSLGIGAWGAALATGLGVRQVRHDRRRVSVRARFGYSDLPGLARVLTVWVANDGHRAVEVRSVHFRMENGYDLLAIPPVQPGTLPKVLNDGEGVAVHFPALPFEGMAKEAREVESVVVTDASGREYLADFPPIIDG